MAAIYNVLAKRKNSLLLFASFTFMIRGLLLPLRMKPTTKRFSSFFLLLFCYPLLVICGFFF
ncbi:hypothetical protein DW150_05930 [Phocaeicola vulgatus]|uniref:Uncharacterized protein n=1 Tax=Phocaeicola vulgatus TaxID=821 RepID=A0A415BUC6_PHOVU|nr:hypothetical protein DW150_05930 [Phocaeicola vulgatus]